MSKPLTYAQKVLARLGRLETFVGMGLKLCGFCGGLGAVTRWPTGAVGPPKSVCCEPCGGLGTSITNAPKEGSA